MFLYAALNGVEAALAKQTALCRRQICICFYTLHSTELKLHLRSKLHFAAGKSAHAFLLHCLSRFTVYKTLKDMFPFSLFIMEKGNMSFILY